MDYVDLWRALEIWVRNHLRSSKMAPFNKSYTTFCQCAIIGTIFELFDAEEYRELEI